MAQLGRLRSLWRMQAFRFTLEVLTALCSEEEVTIRRLFAPLGSPWAASESTEETSAAADKDSLPEPVVYGWQNAPRPDVDALLTCWHRFLVPCYRQIMDTLFDTFQSELSQFVESALKTNPTSVLALNGREFGYALDPANLVPAGRPFF